ncbi:MAG: hypothetical protein U0414_23190 [Polyangiaceae bacterium]
MTRRPLLTPLLSCGAATLLGALLSGCGGAPTAPSGDDVFYLHGNGLVDKNRTWESYYPKFDAEKTDRLPRYVGVGVLDGDVRFARPTDWNIRSADYTPEHRYISYQSPRQFTFSIYERIDAPAETWPEVEKHYEKETKEQGSDILASRIPVGTANAQGRAYLLHTQVRAKPNFDGYATEILLRSGSRVLLVQVVHRQDTDTIMDEVTAVLDSMVVY